MNFEEFVTSIPDDESSIYLKRIFLNKYEDINARIRKRRDITYGDGSKSYPAVLFDLKDEMFLLIDYPVTKYAMFVDRDKFMTSNRTKIVSQKNGDPATITYIEKDISEDKNFEYTLHSTWRGSNKPYLDKRQTILGLMYDATMKLFVKETRFRLIDGSNKPSEIIQNIYKDQHIYKNNKSQMHRIDGPAYVCYYKNGKPAQERWHFNDLLHREDDLPAEICYDQLNRVIKLSWYQNGNRERKKGPAEVYYRYDHHAVIECYYKNDVYLHALEREM